LRTQFAIAVVAALGIAAFASPVFSADTPQQANMKSCAAKWSGMAAADKSKTTYKDYMSSCMKAPASTAAAAPAAMTAKPVAAAMTAKPVTAKATPAAAAMKSESGTAKCKDGKTVTYAHRSGTCSGHGGVASWM
jgi:Protein of unknown function (DUF3761)